MLLPLAFRNITVDIILSPAHCGIQRNGAADIETEKTRYLPQGNVPIWHVDFVTAIKRIYWQEVQQEEECGEAPRSAVVGSAITPFHLDPDILGKEARPCA
ncbi:hypothetical protein LSM04_002842 [Trypanosoma melophagium]|uniref:uncharacterized protein n=1 Tax=Trypanosoma melophagium TaxID=715481 RepID=UPI00351A1CB9|nr:hypothetical protein LSM04_002842 [Trypanosoma melophagium]